ncbi:ABC transporter substrate-binding protein [Polaromonas sp.]|uniref:ABC transporter substrate-binding protein n=1 Tax=Polaromonas sp. TaxID=1869339 RepID=UPI003264A1D1
MAHAQVRRPSTSAEALDEPGNGFDPRRNRHLAAARYAVLVAAAYVLFAWIAPASVHAESIVVGQTLSLTGPSPRVAQDLLRGRQACADWINAQGGIRGQSLKIVTRDDRNDPALAVKQAQELVDREGAVAFFGSMGPSVNAAVLDWANAQGMAVLGPYGGDIENRTRRYDTAYFLTANQSAEAERLALHVASLGMNRVVIVHSSDPAGRAALTALEEGLGGTNVAAIALIAAKPDGSDAATVAQSVSKAKAQAVLLATSGRATIALLQSLTAASSSGLNLLQIYGLSSAASQAELIELGARARGFAMSQVVPLPRDTRIPVVLAFHSAMRGIPGERTYAELEGCMASLLLGEVLRRKPVTSNRAAILQAMRSTGRVNLGGFEIDLNDRTRPGSQYTDIVYIGFEGKITR